MLILFRSPHLLTRPLNISSISLFHLQCFRGILVTIFIPTFMTVEIIKNQKNKSTKHINALKNLLVLYIKDVLYASIKTIKMLQYK